jgi:hypothetical protein
MWRTIAKMVVREGISLYTARTTHDIIVDHTEIDPDSIPLKLGSMVVGEVVATKAKPYTDQAIDNAADWIAKKRNKTETTEESNPS